MKGRIRIHINLHRSAPLIWTVNFTRRTATIVCIVCGRGGGGRRFKAEMKKTETVAGTNNKGQISRQENVGEHLTLGLSGS